MTSDIAKSAGREDPRATSDITTAADEKPRRGRAPAVLAPHLEQLWGEYLLLLGSAPLDDDSRRAYASRVRTFFAWLDGAGVDSSALFDPAARDGAVRDWRTHLQKVLKRKPATINAHLAALTDFYTRTGVGAPNAKRLELPSAAPRALDERNQKRWLRTCERCTHPRNRAIGYIPFYAGLRISEITALDLGDVRLSARKGLLIVRSGKGGRYREVPVHPVLRENLALWINEERPSWPGAANNPAVFLNHRGERLSVKGCDDILGDLASDAGFTDNPDIDFTTQILRHTFGTNLVREGHDVVLVAELMGHARLETTRRYTKPSEADRQNAIDTLPTDR